MDCTIHKKHHFREVGKCVLFSEVVCIKRLLKHHSSSAVIRVLIPIGILLFCFLFRKIALPEWAVEGLMPSVAAEEAF